MLNNKTNTILFALFFCSRIFYFFQNSLIQKPIEVKQKKKKKKDCQLEKTTTKCALTNRIIIVILVIVILLILGIKIIN